jgi:hypothetical protein
MNSPVATGLPCPSRAPHSIWSSDVAILTYFAVATIVVHLFTGERYGFHRDELACAYRELCPWLSTRILVAR